MAETDPPPDSRQTDHANRIAVERALMRSSGKSRADVRESLRKDMQEFRREVFNRAPQQPAAARLDAPLMSVESVSFEPRPLTLELPRGGAAPPNAAPTVTFTAVRNGAFVYYYLQAEGPFTP